MALEEGAKTARTFMESLKDQPLSLALVVMNVMLLGLLYYNGITAANERHVEMQLLYENRKFVGQLLANCTTYKPEQK